MLPGNKAPANCKPPATNEASSSACVRWRNEENESRSEGEGTVWAAAGGKLHWTNLRRERQTEPPKYGPECCANNAKSQARLAAQFRLSLTGNSLPASVKMLA